MTTILNTLAELAKQRVENAKNIMPVDEIKSRALTFKSSLENFAFENALKRPGLSFICECKKASPSKGLIAPEFNYLKIAREYELAGADCISVLTEPEYFLGHDNYLKEIANIVKIPCLRKDFVIDEYMIFQAKLLNASAVLLICALLNEKILRKYISTCDKLGLSALVEAHDENEINMALNSGARVIGVNNRNLKDFSMNTDNALKLRNLIPENKNILFVSESGVKNSDDVKKIRDSGADAVLIGEALMKAPDKIAMLKEFKNI